MASNAQLRGEIEDLAAKLNLDEIPEPEKPSNKTLTELRDQLAEKVEKLPKPTEGDLDKSTLGGPPKAAPAKPSPPVYPLSVAANRMVTSPRGPLCGQGIAEREVGDEVKSKDFPPDVLADLIAKGAVIDQRSTPPDEKG